MPASPLTSSQNPTVKRLRSLRLRKHRERERLFWVEGIRAVEEALDRGAPVETIVYAPELLVSDRAQSLVERVGPASRLAVSANVFRGLSERDEPQGVAAAVRIVGRPLAAIRPAADLLLVVAYQLSDPGNLGEIIRTADAAGATGVAVVTPSVDLYDPQAVRATMGSLFALPIAYPVEPAELERWAGEARAAGVPLAVVATSAHAQQDYWNLDLTQPLVLLLGNERTGLPHAAREQADALARLPMRGSATSLNVSAAAAALLYEAVRQRAAPVKD